MKILHCDSNYISSLSHLKDIRSPAFNYINRRKYSNQYISELRSNSLTANGQIYAGRIPKSLCSETYPFLQSSGLQHWFKNWQKLRKHKLTASTFGTGLLDFGVDEESSCGWRSLGQLSHLLVTWLPVGATSKKKKHSKGTSS